jgi:hypothetical protein
MMSLDKPGRAMLLCGVAVLNINLTFCFAPTKVPSRNSTRPSAASPGKALSWGDWQPFQKSDIKSLERRHDFDELAACQ